MTNEEEKWRRQKRGDAAYLRSLAARAVLMPEERWRLAEIAMCLEAEALPVEKVAAIERKGDALD